MSFLRDEIVLTEGQELRERLKARIDYFAAEFHIAKNDEVQFYQSPSGFASRRRL
jgi:hypothetical protein